MTTLSTDAGKTTEVALTAQQVELASALNERVKTLEVQGGMATFSQARALGDIRDQDLYKAIQKPDGGFYQNFGEYIQSVSTKNPSTISQNITVVGFYNGFSDEDLVRAGSEKLYVTYRMVGENHYKTPQEAFDAALKFTRVELMSIRSSGKEKGVALVPLGTVRVTQALANRFDAGWEKFRRILNNASGRNDATDSQVADLFLNVMTGLPNDFLTDAANGIGGAAPSTEDGYSPQDVPLDEVVYFIADKLVEQGRDPEEVLDMLKIGVQAVKDRADVLKRERAEQEKKDKKAQAEKDKALNTWVKRLQNAKQGQRIIFADGAEAIILDTTAKGDDNQIHGVFLKAVKDGSELVFDDSGKEYGITTIAGYGIVEIVKAPPAVKPPKPPKAEAAPKQAKPAKEAKPAKSAKSSNEVTALGISKEQSAGKKPKVAKKAPVQQEAEQDSEGSFSE